MTVSFIAGQKALSSKKVASAVRDCKVFSILFLLTCVIIAVFFLTRSQQFSILSFNLASLFPVFAFPFHFSFYICSKFIYTNVS